MRIKHYIIAAIFSLSLSGCLDLEYENYTMIPSEQFPESEADLIAATTGVYHTLGKSYIMTYLDYSGFTINTLCTDELNTSWGDAWEQNEQFQWSANNCSASTVYYLYCQGVTKATRIIDAFENSSVNENLKTTYVAELKALRIFYAQCIYTLFGAIPLVTDPDVANDVYTDWEPTRPTNEEYVAFMVDELLEAIPNLDVETASEDWGRFSKGAAMTLLMKIYLNEKMWSEAADMASQIIALGHYSLQPVYKDIFDINNEGPSNRELILPIQRITSNTSYSWSYFACVMPSSPLYKSEIGNTMSIWGGLKMPWEFYDKYESQDSRLDTIIRYYTDTDGNEVDYRTVDHAKATGAAPMKYSEDPEHQGSMQGSDFVVYRYADVILSYAEALNEINGPTQQVVDLINEIRGRANATLISTSDFASIDEMRSFILDERGRELYCEGHRRADLIRHGEFINKATEAGFLAYDYMTLYPIPQSALDENSNMTQNPGYEN